MKNLLVINASARVSRSITRRLTARFVEGWRLRHQRSTILARDVGSEPTAFIDEKWIAAAFTPQEVRTAQMREHLALSDSLIDEIVQADAVVVGVPMYNFGMPGHLKAYLDQVVRIGRTFSFDAGAAEPYQPLLESKPVVVITSAGDGAIQPGGTHAHLNFLDGHLETILGFIGLTQIHFVHVAFEEYGDDRFQQSLAAAERSLEEILDQLSEQTRAGDTLRERCPMPTTATTSASY